VGRKETTVFDGLVVSELLITRFYEDIDSLYYFFTTTVSISAQIENRLYREGDLHKLMAGLDTDKNLQFERLISYHFHHLLNEYRASKGKRTLYWDDRLWLAARNHNLYMESFEDLTHAESSKKNFYSGSAPGIRAKYVSYGSIDSQMDGENCVMFGGAYEHTAEEAYAIAENAFSIWRASSGHNENMLSPDYFMHGTAINSNSESWGTTVFASAPSSFEPNEITISWDSDLAAQYPALFTINGGDFKPKEFELRREEYSLYFLLKSSAKEAGLLENEFAFQAAKSHLIYQLNQKEYSLQESKGTPSFSGETSEKRYKKAAGIFSAFKLIGHDVEEHTFQLLVKKEELLNRTAFVSFENQLTTTHPIPANAVSWGGIVQLIPQNDAYLCIADIVYVLKKKG
jgi:hypothetical protein